MGLGVLAMEVFSEQSNSNPVLVNFARSAAGLGLVAGARQLPAHCSSDLHTLTRMTFADMEVLFRDLSCSAGAERPRATKLQGGCPWFHSSA